MKRYGHPIAAIAKRPGQVEGIHFSTELIQYTGLDTVTLYIGTQHQPDYINYILSLKPKRIIFNPGTENELFELQAKQQGIQVLEACTLVMLGTGQY